MWGDVFNITGGTVTNSKYIAIPAINKTGGTLTNQYGIYIDDQDAAATLNYSIYTNAGDVRLMSSSSDKIGFHGSTWALRGTIPRARWLTYLVH